MESNFYSGSAPGADEAECNSYLDRLMTVGDSDMEDLRSREFEWKLRKYNDIKFAKEQFEEKCSARYIPEVRKSIASRFDFDMLKLICIMRDDDKIRGTAIEEAVRNTPMEEITALERLESFSGIDAYNAEKITEALMRKHGQIYDVIRNWYNSQMDEFNKVLDATPQSRMRNTIKREILARYDHRFETLTRGLIEYMKKDSTAAARLFNEYTEIVNRAFEAQSKWDEVVAGFGYVPITETERKYDLLESSEAEATDLLDRLRKELVDSQAPAEVLGRIAGTYRNMLDEHEALRADIGQKIDEITTVIDKGNALVSDLLAGKPEGQDEKALAVQNAQREYIGSRIEEMKKSLESLKDFEDHVEMHVVKYRSDLEQVDELARSAIDGLFITVDQVRIQAVDLLSRFKKKMEESLPLKLMDPLRNSELKISTRNELYSAALDENRDGSNKDVMITGTTFRFLKKRILNQPLNLNLSLFYLIHKNRLNQNAVDNRPFSLSEFVDLVLNLMDNYSSDSATTYVVLISPTGFDSRVVDYLSGDHRLYARNLFIYAMDPISGSTFSNKPIPDPVISNIVNMQLEEEKHYRYRRAITDALDRFNEISLERIAEDQKMNLELLKAVAEDLEDEKEISVDKKKGIHFVMRSN